MALIFVGITSDKYWETKHVTFVPDVSKLIVDKPNDTHIVVGFLDMGGFKPGFLDENVLVFVKQLDMYLLVSEYY